MPEPHSTIPLLLIGLITSMLTLTVLIFFTGVQLSDDKNGGISPPLNPGYFNLHLFGLDEPNSICSNHSYEVGIQVTRPRSTDYVVYYKTKICKHSLSACTALKQAAACFAHLSAILIAD